jgi:hypothetical protein
MPMPPLGSGRIGDDWFAKGTGDSVVDPSPFDTDAMPLG